MGASRGSRGARAPPGTGAGLARARPARSKRGRGQRPAGPSRGGERRAGAAWQQPARTAALGRIAGLRAGGKGVTLPFTRGRVGRPSPGAWAAGCGAFAARIPGRHRRWRRVVSARVKRVTPTQALQRKQGPAEGAVARDAGDRVARARGLEPADRPEDREEHLRERELVEPDGGRQSLGQHVCRAPVARAGSAGGVRNRSGPWKHTATAGGVRGARSERRAPADGGRIGASERARVASWAAGSNAAWGGVPRGASRSCGASPWIDAAPPRSPAGTGRSSGCNRPGGLDGGSGRGRAVARARRPGDASRCL